MLVQNVQSLVDWKKCPQSLVCFWQIRMRRMRAWNNNEVEKLSRLRHFFGKIQTDKHVQYGEIFIGLEVTNFEIVGRMLMCAVVKIECRTLRRACIWRLESEGCCEVSTAGLTPSCETCGSQSHRLACLGGILLRHFAILWNTILCLRDKDWVESELCVMRSCFEEPASGTEKLLKSKKTCFASQRKFTKVAAFIFQFRPVLVQSVSRRNLKIFSFEGAVQPLNV